MKRRSGGRVCTHSLRQRTGSRGTAGPHLHTLSIGLHHDISLGVGIFHACGSY